MNDPGIRASCERCDAVVFICSVSGRGEGKQMMVMWWHEEIREEEDRAGGRREVCVCVWGGVLCSLIENTTAVLHKHAVSASCSHQAPVLFQSVLIGPPDPAAAEASAPPGWGGMGPAAARWPHTPVLTLHTCSHCTSHTCTHITSHTWWQKSADVQVNWSESEKAKLIGTQTNQKIKQTTITWKQTDTITVICSLHVCLCPYKCIFRT